MVLIALVAIGLALALGWYVRDAIAAKERSF
jgi:hypothetical protein